MIYVISKATYGSYNVRDIQCNANWCSCPYSDYALIPDSMVDGILATQGYCDITLNEAGTEVLSFTARTIPSVPEECCGTKTVLEEPHLVTDWNKAKDNGWYRDKNGTEEKHSPFVGHASYGYVVRYSSGALVQVAFSAISRTTGVYGRTMQQKIRFYNETYDFNGGWGEWEYVNPPFLANWNEYRTTERYLGKPVYTKIVPFGSMPASDWAGITHDADVSQIVRCNGQNITLGSNLDCIIHSFPDGPIACCSADKTHVYVHVHTDCSAYEANIQIWYTKP